MDGLGVRWGNIKKKIMSFISDLFSGGASKLVDSVGNTLDKIITTKEEKLHLENEIKKAELDYQVELQKLSLEDKKAFYGEMGNARNREMTIQQSSTATKLGKNISSFLAIGATVLCFSMFYILLFREKEYLNSANHDIIIYILGVLSALLTQIFNYYFGSSSGSADKSRTLAQALENKHAN